MTPVRRVRCRVVPAVLLAAVAGQVDLAATFEPEVRADAVHSNNVYFLPGENEPRADWFARLGLFLAVRGESARGPWALNYEPAVLRYLEESELDRWEHRASLNGETRAGRRTTLAYGAAFTRTYTQGGSGSLEPQDLLLVPRAELDVLSASVSARREIARRWTWTGELLGSDLDYAAVGEDTGLLEDRRSYGAALEFERSMSPSATFGIEYRLLRSELDATGDENDHIVAFTSGLGISENTILTVVGGAFLRAISSEEDSELDERDQRIGAHGRVALDHVMREAMLHVEAAHVPSTGGALAGTSTDTTASLGWSGSHLDRWLWTTSARWARRRPTIEGEPILESMGAGAESEWRPHPRLGWRLGGDWLRQTGGESVGLDGSFVTVRVGMTWYTRGSSRSVEQGR